MTQQPSLGASARAAHPAGSARPRLTLVVTEPDTPHAGDGRPRQTGSAAPSSTDTLQAGGNQVDSGTADRRLALVVDTARSNP